MYFSALPSSCNVLKQRWASSMIFTTMWTTQACNPACWCPLEVERFSTQLLRNAILLRSFEKWRILCREISKVVLQHEISEVIYVNHLNVSKKRNFFKFSLENFFLSRISLYNTAYFYNSLTANFAKWLRGYL